MTLELNQNTPRINISSLIKLTFNRIINKLNNKNQFVFDNRKIIADQNLFSCTQSTMLSDSTFFLNFFLNLQSTYLNELLHRSYVQLY